MTASTDTDTLVRYRPDELALFHRNPRLGNVEVIEGSLHANGQYKPILVNLGTHTGRPLEVLAGNHTLKAIRNLAEANPGDRRWDTVTAYVIDVDDDRATRIVAADNRTAELGTTDDALIAQLLSDMDDLTGTGYTDSDLAAMLASNEAGDLEDGEATERGTGEAVQAWGPTVGEPDIAPERGSVWQLGIHTLAVADVNKDHTVWGQYLTADHWFYPYPSLLAPFVAALETQPVVFVQPSPYLAGWLLTKWNRVNPDRPAEQVSP